MNYLLFTTKNGLVKKTEASQYRNIRASGLIAIKLDRNDELLNVSKTSGSDEVMLITAQGKAIRFPEEEIRPTGRATRGVTGIKVKNGDFVIGAKVIPQQENLKPLHLLVVSAHGFGKMTKIKEYKKQKRGGQGIFTAKVSAKTGPLRAAQILSFNKGEEKKSPTELLIASREGKIIRLKLSAVPVLGRQTQGVHLIRLDQNDEVATIAPITHR